MSNEPTGSSLTPFEDPLNKALSLEASLTTSGVKASAVSRTLAALDSLVGAAIDAGGGAWLDGVRRRQRVRDAVKEKLAYIEGEGQVEDALAARARARIAQEEIRKQDAREVVAEMTIEQLRLLPGPSAESESDAPELDPDWMDAFSAFAERATDDGLRRLWARLLAGEINAPGSFSKSTIRVISEMDAKAAQSFSLAMPYRLPEGYICVGMAAKAGVDLQVLMDADLLVSGVKAYAANEHQGSRYWMSGDWVLRINHSIKTGAGENSFSPYIAIPVRDLTRAGREISRIFPAPDVKSLITELGNSLDKWAETIELFQITHRDDKGVHFDKDRPIVLRTKPT